MFLDVIAIQALYGKNESTNAGNSSFSLTETGFYYTLWDASGTDLLDASSAHEGWTVRLPSQPVSSVVDTKFGYAAPTSQLSLAAPSTLVWLAGDYENVTGSNYGDNLIGNQFRNVFVAGAGNDLVDGGSEIDTAVFRGSAGQYAITLSGANATVRDLTAGRDGTDSLTGIERLHFADITVALDSSGDAGQGYRLYQAAYNRAPDQGGVSFWINALDHGMSLHDVSVAFVTSAEFHTIYGASPTPPQVAFSFYGNVLGRAPDAGGLAFWTAAANKGMPYSDLLLAFSESAENVAHVAPTIAHGITLDNVYWA
jgi:hypothetical protein